MIISLENLFLSSFEFAVQDRFNCSENPNELVHEFWYLFNIAYAVIFQTCMNSHLVELGLNFGLKIHLPAQFVYN